MEGPAHRFGAATARKWVAVLKTNGSLRRGSVLYRSRPRAAAKLIETTQECFLLSQPWRMRVLEARFHPRTKTSGSFVVVGRVYCNGRRAWIEIGRASCREGVCE